jgi:methionyl aminopeptidase
MIIIKSGDELAKMKLAGAAASRVCDVVASGIAPGMTTAELDRIAGAEIRRLGARSASRGYKGFPGEICISVNEEVVHGIPGRRRIAAGDIVSIDIVVLLEGFLGDVARTVMVGVFDPDLMRLVETTERALCAAVNAARAGNRVSDISHAIEREAVSEGFSVVKQFVGHGIGRRMHEDPQIPNFGPPGRGAVLKPGMTLAIEPMINMGCSEVEVLADGWTAVTKDRLPSAHFEHTVAVGDSGAEILTK